MFSTLDKTQLHSQANDRKKAELALSLGYKLVTVWESDIQLFDAASL